jgi:hypothetical protein
MSATQTPSCKKNTLPITELPRNWWPTELKHGSQPVLNDSANVQVSTAAGPQLPYMLVSVFTLVFWLRLVRHTCIISLSTTVFLFYRRTEKSSFISQNACTYRDIP